MRWRLEIGLREGGDRVAGWRGVKQWAGVGEQTWAPASLVLVGSLPDHLQRQSWTAARCPTGAVPGSSQLQFNGNAGADGGYLLVAGASALWISWTAFHDPSACLRKMATNRPFSVTAFWLAESVAVST